ncbi:MAG TPA: helix-turn-helix transcriptional regulator [Solirubrobacteraceae bacterium]|jgi:DNA-binding PadR family transcriptional regulator|nr:helix-turn-helix transcriptional regulator [Solirubrobacteraceae bacterium]
MSAKHAVLGLVIERPGYGYDLAQRLRERFGSSGFAPTGVYSALDQLSAEGLVRSAGRLGGGSTAERAAPRTIYEATPAGAEQFDRWMRAQSPPANVRDELNMKLSLSRPQDLPALIELVCAQERECMSRLQALREPFMAGGDSGATRRQLAWNEVAALLVRDAEIRQLQARVEWLQRVRAIMSRLSDPARAEARGADTQTGTVAESATEESVTDESAADESAAKARVA